MGDAIIPDDWTGEYCRFAVCWPNSPQWLAVLRGALSIPATGRFWEESSGTITEAQAIVQETFDYNFDNLEVIMACGDSGLSDIAVALGDIAISMQQSISAGCCDDTGTGGAGTYPEEIESVSKGDPITDPPPAGFSSWEQFYQNKCNRATDFIIRLKATFTAWKTYVFGTTQTRGAMIALALLTSVEIPFVSIGAILLLMVGVVAESILSACEGIIDETDQDLLCALYSSVSPADARAAFMEIVYDYADANLDPLDAVIVKQLFELTVSNDELNALEELDTFREYAEGDCSNCDQVSCAQAAYHFDEDAEGWTQTGLDWELNRPVVSSLTWDNGKLNSYGTAVTYENGQSWGDIYAAIDPEPPEGVTEFYAQITANGTDVYAYVLALYEDDSIIQVINQHITEEATWSNTFYTEHPSTESPLASLWLVLDGASAGSIDDVLIGIYC